MRFSRKKTISSSIYLELKLKNRFTILYVYIYIDKKNFKKTNVTIQISHNMKNHIKKIQID